MKKNKAAALNPEYHLQQSEIMIATPDFRDGAFAFIAEGTVAMRELGHYGVSEPIPKGECAISALVAGKSREKIYGATAGSNAHLFYYDPSPMADHVVDIGVLGKDAICTQLMVTDDGVLYGILNPMGKVFRYDPDGEYSLLWAYHVNPIEWLEVSLDGEVAAAVMDGSAGRIYGLKRQDSRLFAYDLDDERATDLGAVDRAGNCNALVIDSQGFLYGSCRNSHLFRFSSYDGKKEILDVQVPAPKGMEYLNYVDSLVFDGARTIYGGTTLGCLFRFDTTTLELTPGGRVITDHRIRSLVIGDDGALYGCAGSPGKNSHLFRWNPNKGEIKDLGLPMVHFPRNWVCYDISSVAIGGNGEVYIGESERVSYLFVYYPPVAKRQA